MQFIKKNCEEVYYKIDDMATDCSVVIFRCSNGIEHLAMIIEAKSF